MWDIIDFVCYNFSVKRDMQEIIEANYKPNGRLYSG